MTDQILKPEIDMLPLGTIIPFKTAEEVHPDFAVLDGQTITLEENTPLVTKMHSRWKNLDLLDSRNIWAHWFWLGNGGEVHADRIIMPVFTPQQVAEYAFGVNHMNREAKPVLAIRYRRAVSSDGTGQVDDPDSDA